MKRFIKTYTYNNESCVQSYRMRRGVSRLKVTAAAQAASLIHLCSVSLPSPQMLIHSSRRQNGLTT